MAEDYSGRTLGNYKLLDLLGEGGFAKVYRGEHIHLGTHAALKVMRASVVGNDAQVFRKEARTIAKLVHDNIVRVLDFSIDAQDNTPFLVMDYAAKGSLRKFCPRGQPLPYVNALSYLKQIASALQYAHDQLNLIHRDIKPENMLIKQNDAILLSDFGIAVVEQTGVQSPVGSLLYIAPEQLQGYPVLASDQYALGIVVYEWLSGNPPFGGTPAELIIQHQTAQPASLSGIVPPAVEAVLMRALEKHPAQRFPRVLDFAQALEKAYEDYAREAPPLVAFPPMSGTFLTSRSGVDYGAETEANSGAFSRPVTSALERATRYTDLLETLRQLNSGYQADKRECQRRFADEQTAIEAELLEEQERARKHTERFHAAVAALRAEMSRSRWREGLEQMNPLRVQVPASLEILTDAQQETIAQSAAISLYFQKYEKARSQYWQILRYSLPALAFFLLLLIFLPWIKELTTLLMLVSLLVSGVSIGLLIYNYMRTKELLSTAYAAFLHAHFAVENMLPVQEQALINSRRERLSEHQQRYTQALAELDQRLSTLLVPHQAVLERYRREDDFLVADWDEPLWSSWRPAYVGQSDQAGRQPIALARLGNFDEAPELPALPVLLICPGQDNVLIETTSQARRSAIQALQSLLLRLLLATPPGKLRLTLIDSTGLGNNLAAFLNLSDYDKQLVSGKVWTRQEQIEQQLAILTDHMEDVFQQFLRNQYRNIDEYNREAGEIAEPYRLLVIVGFPNNFSPQMAQQLTRIATAGPRSGVYLLMVADTELPLPFNFNVGDLERASQVIGWNGQRFTWNHKVLGVCNLRLDSEPAPALFNQLLGRVGEKTMEVRQRIEIPFRTAIQVRGIPQYSWWSPDNTTVDEISVPLGRLGATRYQYLRLGAGTAHHVLIVGTTGSGKTNLLNVLLTGLALKYHPEELEFYLIDFKTVGFTPYANYRLPHARVIAVQSERTFGLGVLEGLQRELDERKRLFAQARVQDISQFRKLRPHTCLPRILLVIDEFQELFMHNDESAQSAAIYLNRFVRTGRGLGIHVLLASQTLAGLHSSGHSTIIDSSTISQMTVRIAMRSEKGDSRIILHDENTSLEYLFQLRPGEAIYNADSGAEAGNNRFQSFWLSDADLSIYLAATHHLAQSHNYRQPFAQRIFDGSKNAEIEKNQELQDLLLTPEWSNPASARIWLGDPVSLRDNITVPLYPRAESNLLLLGREESVAVGLLALAFFALAAQHAPAGARFFLLDVRSDTPYLKNLRAREQQIPHQPLITDKNGAVALIGEIAREVQRRSQADAANQPPLYLFIPGLQRVPALRTDARNSSEVLKQFESILCDGPERRVHTFLWCDTLNNLARSLAQPLLQEFSLRIALQMAENEAQQFSGSVEASQLGPYRALLYRRDEEIREKFVPYDPPTAEWLVQTVRLLRQKH
ncbi:MAG TPA: FtsK/SpoIIIE domain-containing protein [Ktedonobacteraceae bacterium]